MGYTVFSQIHTKIDCLGIASRKKYLPAISKQLRRREMVTQWSFRQSMCLSWHQVSNRTASKSKECWKHLKDGTAGVWTNFEENIKGAELIWHFSLLFFAFFCRGCSPSFFHIVIGFATVFMDFLAFVLFSLSFSLVF